MNSLHDGDMFDMSDSSDISPNRDRSILKKVMTRGIGSYGYPVDNDTVVVSWKIYSTDGQILHNSDSLPEPFDFKVNARPSQVISAWDYAVKSMFQKEVASLLIKPEYGFGENGAEGIIKPNASLLCELELVEIIPAITRQYKSVGYNESIQDELLDNIRSGKSPISQNVMDNKPIAERTSDTQRKYFDPSKHKIDPNQRVSGEGEMWIWDETPNVIEIQIKLPATVTSKNDLDIDLRFEFV